MTQVSDVLTAQLVLDHHLITEAVSALTVTETKFWDKIYSAHNVNGAHQDLSQIQREKAVSSSQDQLSTSMVFQLVMNSQYSTWIELSASSAQVTWRLLKTTWDAWTHVLIHLILFKRTVAASLAAMVTYQTTVEQDVLRSRQRLTNVKEIERSTTQIEPDVPLVTHTPEPKDKIPSAFQTNVVPTKLSLG